MAVDPNIKKKADDIRNKVYGKEVRESLASGLEAMSSDVVENEGRQSVVENRQDDVESQWQNVVDETTNLDVVSAPEIIAARDGETNLKARLDKEKNEVTAQLAQNDNKVDVYVSPKNFSNLNDCISHARENKKIIKADYIKLEEPTNFRGVGLEINELEINGYSIVLGDYNNTTLPIVEGNSAYRPSQTIEIIYGRSGWDSEVFVRGASYQTIKIGHYSGNIQLVVNRDPDSNFIAYNEFYFRNVRGVKIRTEETVIDRLTGWVNENKFYMMNTRIFTMGNKNGYTHNNNFIYGGCFEGNGLIEIVSGRNNYFYDIRGEQNLKIRFHERADRNIIQLSLNSYLATVRDDSDGNDNIVINADERNKRIKHHHSISTNHSIGGNESGYKMEVVSPFKNFRFEEDEGTFKQIPRTTGSGNNIFYVSPFLSDPKNIQILLESHLKMGGLGIGYKLYDENYNDITSSFIENGFDAYMVMSHVSHIDNNENEGIYRGASNFLQLRNNTGEADDNLFNVGNDIIALSPAPTWKLPEVRDRIKTVSYVKFFIGNTGDEESISFYDLTVTIYDISANYHKRYFGNQASSLEWTQPAG